MVNELTTSQQVEMASKQQQSRQIIRHYKIPHRGFGRQQTPPEKWYQQTYCAYYGPNTAANNR
uniref:Uncharacterized protein n=1 Tax=Romanomermis culicivorax TaxID=13658 RepID=A0A915KA14_ROMCU